MTFVVADFVNTELLYGKRQGQFSFILHYHERSLNYDLYHIVINDWVLAPENFNVIWLSNRLTMSVPDEGYSRNELSAPKI
jgi:hypothetical protein